MQYFLQEFEVSLPFLESTTKQGTPSFSDEQLIGPPKRLTDPAHVYRHCVCTMEMGIHKTARFIKKVDEMRDIEMGDRLSLFKQACMEATMTFAATRHHGEIIHFPEDNTYAKGGEGEVLRFIRIVRSDVNESKKKFFSKYNKLNLTKSERALFKLLIILAPGKCDLNYSIRF